MTDDYDYINYIGDTYVQISCRIEIENGLHNNIWAYSKD